MGQLDGSSNSPSEPGSCSEAISRAYSAGRPACAARCHSRRTAVEDPSYSGQRWRKQHWFWPFSDKLGRPGTSGPPDHVLGPDRSHRWRCAARDGFRHKHEPERFGRASWARGEWSPGFCNRLPYRGEAKIRWSHPMLAELRFVISSACWWRSGQPKRNRQRVLMIGAAATAAVVVTAGEPGLPPARERPL